MARPRSRIESPEVSTSYMCEFFDVTRETISEWTKNGMPKVETGAYNLKAAFDWWQENINKDDDDATLTAAKRKYWAAKAGNEELKESQTRGTLISKKDVITEWAARCAELKTSLRAWASRLPQVIEGKTLYELRKILLDNADELLSAYCRNGSFTPKEARNERKQTKKKRSKR